MAMEPASLDRGPVWSTGIVTDRDAPSNVRLPVRLSGSGAAMLQGDLRGGDDDVVAVGDEPAVKGAVAEPEPDAVARGWVIPPGGSRVDALFVLAGTSLGIGRVERATAPVWLNLDDLVNLDAIGDSSDGLTEVEITMEDRRVIGAGWPDDFCGSVVEVLRTTSGRPTATPGSPAATAHLPAPTPEPAPVIEVAAVVNEPSASTASPFAPAGPSPVTESAALELEDVVYLGGHPGHSKRRKKCVVSMSRSSMELKGPGDVHFRVGWEDVRTIEVQNSDEARFRMNTKIHRDASALVVECDQGVTILLEARDCPTLALRSAITQLLDGMSVVVV